MLAHCINPDCRVALQTFSEGRLFQFEVVSISIPARDDRRLPFDEKPRRQTSHFWLCGNCATRLSLTVEPSEGLRLVPLADEEGALGDASRIPRDEAPAQPASQC